MHARPAQLRTRNFCPPTWAHGALLVGAVGAVLFHIFVVPFGAQHWGLFNNMLDVNVYAAGGLAVLENRTLYAGPVYGPMPFTYPPFSALLFTGLALMDQTVLQILWTVATVAALYATVVLCWKSLGYRIGQSLLLAAVPMTIIATVLEPVRTTLWYGQINIFLMLLIVWDLTRPQGGLLRGIGVGIAAGIKLTPGFFFVYLALTRQWRTLYVSIVALLGTIVVAAAVIPRDSWTFWRGTLFESERIGQINAPANQSITGVLAQIFNTTEPPKAIVGIVTLAVLVLALVAIWLAHRADQHLLAITLAGLTASMVSPFSWGHHWVWFVPLIIALCHYAVLSQRLWVWSAPVLVALPVLCWVQVFTDPTQPSGRFYAIGTFMLLPPDAELVLLVRSAFPGTMLIVTLTTIAVLGWRELGRTQRAHRLETNTALLVAAHQPETASGAMIK
ncbi:DUF2029 domain-containing protein [Hoyosella rhizosphaerae]|uniref:DUF2029 domain-containing protein n=1 Tax=Hoyosella rhizosphaerae TaxID=1755582 RepID=A0A916U8D8_9ACTN|nr:glycosyltransferase 87 family protein [Hoyosella rhizosphaerae]MBN4927630.1 DUF2029 domain-containing protein [Hoyosella rhizosphaerae]GGC62944.1 hypothetical protein GCM10011410_14210 [Hoyosella rhizosphaerae]